MFGHGATIIVIILYCLILCSTVTLAQGQKKGCEYWQSRVIPTSKIKSQTNEIRTDGDLSLLLQGNNSRLNITHLEDLTESETLEGIKCLLKLKGNKTLSDLSVMRADVSQYFVTTTPVEVAALYYVSYIFLQKWDHADAAFLVDKRNKLNSRKTVSIAYKAYKKWFAKVKKIGLEEARKQKLDPLRNSGVRWY